MAADGSTFSLGDLVNTVGSLISDTTQTFKDQIATAAQNKAVGFSQGIINGLSRAEQDTSRFLGLSKPMDLVTAPAPSNAGAVQQTVSNWFGKSFSTGQVVVLTAATAVLLYAILWMFKRS